MRKKRLIFTTCIFTAILVFSGVVSTSAIAQSNEGQDNAESNCQTETASSSTECGLDESDARTQEYWANHCQGSLGRYVDQPSVPEVVFSDRLYFRGIALFTHSVSNYEYRFDLPVIAEDEVFVFTEVWCLRGKFQSAFSESTEYILGDIEVSIENRRNLPAFALVTSLAFSENLDDLTHAARKVYSIEELENSLESDTLYITPANKFIKSTEVAIEFDSTIFGHLFPDKSKSLSSDLGDLGPPTNGDELCATSDGSLQCLIVDCVNENYFKLLHPHQSDLYVELVPATYPSASNQIVGLPTWMEALLYYVDYRNDFNTKKRVGEEVFNRVLSYSVDEDGTLKTRGEHFADWAGDVEGCLSRMDNANGDTFFSSKSPRVGFWVYWEGTFAESENECLISVVVSHTSSPVCESSAPICGVSRNVKSTQELYTPLTATFYHCPWGTLYDMGESPDDSDQQWCDLNQEYIPSGWLGLSPDIRSLIEPYAEYIKDCTYTYSRSSLDEPDGSFTVTASHWNVTSCWMTNGDTCGNWWFEWRTEFEVVVREIQALESYRLS